MNNENFDLVTNDENEEFTVEFGEVINDGGTHDYDELDNKPQINGHTLEGNKTNEQLGIPVYTEGTGITLSGNTISADTGVLATKADLNSKQNVIADLPQIRSGAEAGATAVQPEDLARIATTGSYNDSLDKPSINNVTLTGNKSLDALGIQPKGNYALESEIPDVSNFITKDVNNLTNYTLKTNTGSLIDLEINDTTYVVTLKLKNQDGTVISTDAIDLPLESVVVNGRYDNTTKKVILTLENGSEVDFSVADLVAGLQTEITSQNKLASDLVDDTNSGNKFVTTSEKTTWNGKYTKPSGGIPKTDLTSEVQTSLGKADTALQSSDLTNYVTNTDYASNNTAGVIKLNASGYGTSVDPNGALRALVKNYEQYESSNSYYMIGKGTLENVITGKGLNISSINSGENINITNLLPNEYTRLEYIESSGTQYINTNITPTITTGINIDYAYPTVDSNTNAGICGTFQNAYPRTDTLFITSNSGKTASNIFIAHRGVQVDLDIRITANKKYNAKINWLNNGKIEFGDSVSNVGTNNVETDEIRLFGRKSGNNYAYTVARIYGCQFSEGTKIIRNLIPAKRNSDDVIGMYDTVNEIFYENAGTGTFTAGAVLNNIPKINFVNNSGYVTNIDYASSTTAGVIKATAGNALATTASGELTGVSKNYTVYQASSDNMFISKGTLENVITGKGLENKYSRSEIKTGTWIDNKPVYRRIFTIDLGAAPNIAQAHSLTDLDKFWINQSASFVVSSYESLPSTWYYSSADWARTWLTSTNIRFRSPVDLTNRVLYVAIEYTKTTD